MVSAVELEAEAWEMGDFRFVDFFRQKGAGAQGILFGQDVVKIFQQAGDGCGGDFPLGADDQLIPHIAIGMEIVVEIDDFFAGLVDIVGQFEEIEVLLGDQAVVKQVFLDVVIEGSPEVTARSIDQDNGNDRGLAGLNEGNGFKTFIHGAKAAG